MPIGTSARRTAILSTAGRTFLRQGYSDASMDGIAAEVGGSKSTLYRYFPSKAALFAAYVEEVGTLAWAALAAVKIEGREAEVVLEDTARAYLDLILSPSALAVTRLVMAEAGRFPEIGRIFYEHGIRRAERQITAVLQLLAQRSDAPDWAFLTLPGTAAHFRALCEAGLHEECMWGVHESVSQEDVVSVARQAVACFLRGWPGQVRPDV